MKGLVRTFAAGCVFLAASAYGADQPIPLVTAPDYRAIAAANRAAVVGIVAELKAPPAEARTSQSDPGDSDDNGDHCPAVPAPTNALALHVSRPAQHALALGSGFLVRPDGLVLTNAHVVKNSMRVTVKLADRREFTARVLGLDDVTDIAVIKIDAHDLPVVRLGNSDALAVGDYVLAIGAPFGLEETATAGIVSAKSRSLPEDSPVEFIQMDAAVNPGNSGGPLFDAGGAVVGINSQIFSNSGGFQGIAFAIPIRIVEQIEAQILATGRVEHGKLGVQVQDLDQKLAQSFGLESPLGALVASITPHGAAAEAGVAVGDVIVKFDGEAVEDAGALSSHVSLFAPGKSATLVLVRGGQLLTVHTKVQSDVDPESHAAAHHTGTVDPPQLGLTLRPLTRDERTESGIAGGLLVEDAQGAGADAGIQKGDVVLNVAGTQVNSVRQLRALVSPHAYSVPLLVQRGDQRLFVPVDAG